MAYINIIIINTFSDHDFDEEESTHCPTYFDYKQAIHHYVGF